MKLGNPLTLIIMTFLIAACGGGGGGSDSTPVAPAPDPEPASTEYRIAGAAIKGAIHGASISVVDALGNPVGSAVISQSNGLYQVLFNTQNEVALPLLVVLDGTDATAVCDLRPVCNIGQDAGGNPVVVNFGETYALPDGFGLRAAIVSLDTDEDGVTSGTAFISPLSEFVVAAALSMSDGVQLTMSNLADANEHIALLLGDIYPLLQLPSGLDIATIPLVDITDLENADLTMINDLGLAISSISAAMLDFVEPGNSGQDNIALVLARISATVNDALGDTGLLLGTKKTTLLADAAINSLEQTAGELETLQNSGTITVPDSISVVALLDLVTAGRQSLPLIVKIRTNLSTDESVTPTISSAMGWAEMRYLPETGDVDVTLQVKNIDATRVQFNLGYAGQAGTAWIDLEQDAGNPNRWQFPEGTLLDADTIAAISRGQSYFTVLSDRYPAGELRGQVLPTGIRANIATLSGVQQVPVPVNSISFARAAVTLDTATNLAQIHLTGSGTTILSAQVHNAIAGANGPGVVSAAQDPLDGNHWFSADVQLTNDLSDALGAANLYFNVIGPAYPAGELRGQILPDTYDLRLSTLDPGQVVSDQEVASAASGIGAITTNLATNTITAHVNLYQIDTPMAVQIRQGPAGENGAVLFELTSDSLFEFVPQTSAVSHWFLERQALSAEQLVSYLNGDYYLQVTTATYPNGELRGQLTSGLIDSDDDGVPDATDRFPLDASESEDSDDDGVGDNADAFPSDPTESNDADGDGVGDNADAFPNNPGETMDSDSDGTGDNADECPNDPSGTLDSDNDGVCDSDDIPDTQDSDNDGVPDIDDAFPNDPGESEDSDDDGIGNNSDAFPNDSSETTDSDGDGVGDNADDFPNDASEVMDSDGDGVGDNADAFPGDPNESVDVDGDGIGDSVDECIAVVDPDDEDADSDGVVKDCEDVVVFAVIQEIFDDECVSCHGTDGGLNLSSGQAYNNLVNVPSVDVPSIDRVAPGDSDMSYLVWTLEDRDGVVGTVMPPGDSLSDADIDAIKSWIDGGANP